MSLLCVKKRLVSWAEVRRRIGARLHDLGSAIYVFHDSPMQDDSEVKTWQFNVHFTGTAKEADKKYDELIEATCGHDHHPLEPCGFSGGFMRLVSDYWPDFTVDEIRTALDEALHERDREPRTDVWRSFWDRLSEGEMSPDRPAVEADER